MSNSAEIRETVQRYADAWRAGDFRAIADRYHDDIVFYYFGRSPPARTHRGKAACLAVLKQVRQRANRRLLAVRDVLCGDHFGVVIVERFERDGRVVDVERLLRYAVKDGKLSECRVYDKDQRLIDEFYD